MEFPSLVKVKCKVTFRYTRNKPETYNATFCKKNAVPKSYSGISLLPAVYLNIKINIGFRVSTAGGWLREGKNQLEIRKINLIMKHK